MADNLRAALSAVAAVALRLVCEGRWRDKARRRGQSAEKEQPAAFGVRVRALSKEAWGSRILVPDHLQVGASFAGKTVILHSLASRFRQSDSPFSAVVVWDLGQRTPATDELFMQRLALELASALRHSHRDYADVVPCSSCHIKDPSGCVADFYQRCQAAAHFVRQVLLGKCWLKLRATSLICSTKRPGSPAGAFAFALPESCGHQAVNSID